MKITKSQLKQIIKEEISKTLREDEARPLHPEHWLRQQVRRRAKRIKEKGDPVDSNWLFTSIDQYIHHSPALQDNPSATAENIIQAIVDEGYPKPSQEELAPYTRGGYVGR